MKVLKIYADDASLTIDRIQVSGDFSKLSPEKKVRMLMDISMRINARAKRILKEERRKLRGAM